MISNYYATTGTIFIQDLILYDIKNMLILLL